ncbi:ferredoxin hydrogenase [Actinidia rufa]|uniref:Ferredoxin hydrogenase n=1 Tax=Actinidia rufa TaxID=165716 RepID=A0A7J0FX42_9ERIC|nr:ferredoxin hydrogenase [Actinidia rufa]
MSEKFSATLRIGDLNDYIAPSQVCVVSLKGIKPTPHKLHKSENAEKSRSAPDPVQTDPVKISLKDCLACSGCITSAETVMLEKQSLDELLSSIEKGKTVIVSLSPQSRASLAVHFGLSSLQVFKKLTTFLKSLGVKAVFDTSCSRDLALIESCNEFISRYKRVSDDGSCKSSLPMISSACPGWICYAEKTLGSYVLPYISSVKSPQQTMGSIIKQHICQKMFVRPDDVYHVTVMPCYDKKLEAAREDFVFEVESQGGTHENTGLKITEVDSVLTSAEVLNLIQSKSVDFRTLEESSLDKLLTNVNEEGHLYGVHGSSGGYAETIFQYAAKILFGKEIKGPLDFKIIKNSDFREVRLENIVRKIKIGKSDYHFIEVMACPSGCLNGGGQIKRKPGQSPRDFIQLLEMAYADNVLVADPFKNPIVKSLYDEWLDQSGSEKARKRMHTEYHPVELSACHLLKFNVTVMSFRCPQAL